LELLELELDLVEQYGPRSVRSLGLIARSAPALTPALSRDGGNSLDERVASLIVGLTAVLCGAFTLAAPQLVRAFSEQPERSVTVLALTLLLQMFSVRVYGRGSVSVSAIGILTGAFLLNTGTAMSIAMVAAMAQWLRHRGQLYKAVFDIANFALSAAAASLLFHTLPQSRLLAAVLAGLAYAAINNGLLCLVMSLSEEISWRSVWSERFHWARYHFLLFGPLALAGTIAYEQIGVMGLAAFALPPALMILSVRQYLERTSAAVDEIRRVNRDLRRAHRDTIAALSRSMEMKDVYTGGHTERVAAIAVALARELGYRNDELEAIEIGALLHDIGKIGVPEQILRKEGPLDDSEWEVVKTHPVVSDYILSELDLHPLVRECARSSHERIDGAGYPDGLAGDQIPLPARIVFVADAYDALTSTRPYRAARPPFAALAEIRANADTQFCAGVVGALEKLWRTNHKLLHPPSEETYQGPHKLPDQPSDGGEEEGLSTRHHGPAVTPPRIDLPPVAGAESGLTG
jgi:putative nucleotidyltransferase with HDIG domain